MTQFKVGDRVEDFEGDKATVRVVADDKIAVQWDADGKDCNPDIRILWPTKDFTLIEPTKQESGMTTPLVKTETITTKRVVTGKHELSNNSELVIHNVDGRLIGISFSPDWGGGWCMGKHAIAELIEVLQEIHDAMPEVK